MSATALNKLPDTPHFNLNRKVYFGREVVAIDLNDHEYDSLLEKLDRVMTDLVIQFTHSDWTLVACGFYGHSRDDDHTNELLVEYVYERPMTAAEIAECAKHVKNGLVGAGVTWSMVGSGGVVCE